MKDTKTPWDSLNPYRGKLFNGKWPTIRQMFHISAVRYPDRECYVQTGKDALRFTYSQAEDKILAISRYLHSIGVSKGSKVAVSGRNSVQWALAFLSVAYAGAIAIPLDAALTSDELRNIVSFAGIETFFGDNERLSYVKDLSKNLISLDTADSEFSYILNLEGVEFKEPVQDGEDIAAILFTSGTTGFPKGVMLTNNNLISCGFNAMSNMNCYCTDVFYAILPIHHAYTLQSAFFVPLDIGAKVVFGKKMVVSQILKDLKQEKITMFLGVPLLFNKMCSALVKGIKEKGKISYAALNAALAVNGFCRDKLGINPGRKVFEPILDKLSMKDIRICISGGGPLALNTIKVFHRLGIDFVQGYGMTETSPITHLNPIYAFRQESVGKLCAGLEQKIVDTDEQGNGILMLRGECVMKGYYNNQKETDAVLDKDGWLNTGDVGHLDNDGYFYITGRKKNIIVTDGGKNVFPEELEDMFQPYSEFEQVCVVPYVVDAAEKKEGIGVLIYPSAETRAKFADNDVELNKLAQEIVGEVNSKLSGYKRISGIAVLENQMAMTSSRKIKRAETIKQYACRIKKLSD